MGAGRGALQTSMVPKHQATALRGKVGGSLWPEAAQPLVPAAPRTLEPGPRQTRRDAPAPLQRHFDGGTTVG